MTAEPLIRLRLDPLAGGRTTHFYRVAGSRLEADTALPWCEPFAVGYGPPFEPEPPPHVDQLGEPVFSGQAPLGALNPEVSCWSGAWGHRIVVASAGEFHISADGGTVWCLERESEPPENLLGTVVLGPVLLLAMAVRNVWSLHASTLMVGGSAVVLVGRSGSGKSTLAAYLERTHGGWRRAADDILPVSLCGGTLHARPRFPQPKLAPAEQWLESDTLPVRALIELDSVAAGAGDDREIIVDALGGSDTVLLALRHTVAARLFAPDLGKRHFAFCAAVADVVRARRLRFVRLPDQLPQIVNVIRREVEDEQS